MHLLSFGWRSVGRMQYAPTFFSCLDYKKRRQKKIKASTEAEEIGRVRVGDRKRTVFLGNTVGAYCIRPTNVPFMERMTRTVDRSRTYTVDKLLKFEVAAG